MTPVIRINAPDVPTPRELVKELASKLGIKIPRSWTRGDIARRFRSIFRDVGLLLIMVDEAHVLAEGLTPRQIATNARSLKSLLVDLGVPIVLAGEEPLEELLAQPALKRRVHAPARLGAYVWGPSADVGEWMSLIGSLAGALGFDRGLAAADHELAMRAYLDTGGLIGLLAKRMIEAGRLAVRRGPGGRLDLGCFSDAWRRERPAKDGVAVDPFEIDERPARAPDDDPYAVDLPRLKELWTIRFCGGRSPSKLVRPTRLGGRTKREPGFLC